MPFQSVARQVPDVPSRSKLEVLEKMLSLCAPGTHSVNFSTEAEFFERLFPNYVTKKPQLPSVNYTGQQFYILIF